MQLQDYIHYYIGSHFVFDNKRWKSFKITTGTNVLVTGNRWIGDEQYENSAWADDVKLFLRRMISMTEDEKAELRVGTCFDFGSYRPDQFHYLLRQGFDLFGLIDAGLAIDVNNNSK